MSSWHRRYACTVARSEVETSSPSQKNPELTGRLAASYINGVQAKGVAATIKRECGVEVWCHVYDADYHIKTLLATSRKLSEKPSTR